MALTFARLSEAAELRRNDVRLSDWAAAQQAKISLVSENNRSDSGIGNRSYPNYQSSF